MDRTVVLLNGRSIESAMVKALAAFVIAGVDQPTELVLHRGAYLRLCAELKARVAPFSEAQRQVGSYSCVLLDDEAIPESVRYMGPGGVVIIRSAAY